ncbi:tetratricopeptide repeat protein [Fidelibacter multiformis]|jgi:signal transduction histidine kinase/phosphoribosyl-AMP cyclohydrolase|uniref:tetratricopeptide repeat protein n=1 Tax=Fidelibacter multiformis TaxID=3377529 RepID=UPI0037DCE260
MKKRIPITIVNLLLIQTILFAGIQKEPSASDPNTIQTWIDSADYYQSVDPQKALSFYRKIIRYDRDFGAQRFNAEYQLARDFFYTYNNLDSTLKYADMAMKTARAVNDSVKVARIYNLLGTVKLQSGNLEKSLKLLKQAEGIFLKENDLEALAVVYMNLGSVYSTQSKFSDAVDYYNKSRKLYVQLGDKNGEIACLSNLVMIYIQFRQYGIAYKYQQEVYDFYKNSDFIPGILTASTNLGAVHFYLENYDSALVYFNEVLNMSKETGNRYLYSNVLNNIAETHLKQGNLEEAREKAQKSYTLCIEEKDIYCQASALKNLGMIAQKVGDTEKALDYLKQSLPLAEDAHAVMELRDIYSALSGIYKQHGNYQAALEMYEAYINLNESLHEEEVLFRMEELQHEFERQKSRMEILEKTSAVRRAKQIRNMLIVIVAFMIIITIILAVINRMRRNYLKTLQHKNQVIEKEHALVVRHQDHLSLINKILRHDLANNNTAVMSAVKLYKRQKDEEFLDAIIQKAKSSLELIERMKQLEKITASSGTLKPVNIPEIMKRVRLKYPALEWHIQGQGTAFADEALLSVIDNLIENSVTHGEATRIDISIQAIRIHDQPFVEIRVADNGSGISDTIKNRVFDEEFSFGPRARTGLGLYIVKKNIERYQGQIEVEDNSPSGTVMILKIPECPPDNRSVNP